MTLPPIPQDKANHFLYGTVVCAVVTLLTRQPIAGLIAVVALGFAKEVYDLVSKRGTPDWRDVAWTAAGGLVVWAGNV
jgi:hypothetical protein